MHEGNVAGKWLADTVAGKPCNIVELQGTTGSSPAIDRKKGFEQALEGKDTLKIVRSQTGDFTRTKGKEVMESFLKAEDGGKNICALYAHNDMAVGAIQAIKEAGLKPGTDILVVSIDAVPDIFEAMAAGEANATVELTRTWPAPPSTPSTPIARTARRRRNGSATESKLYTQADDPMKVYEEKKYPPPTSPVPSLRGCGTRVAVPVRVPGGTVKLIRGRIMQPDSSYVLAATGIDKIFPGARALNRVDFSRRGEVHALMGENGAGKSTLMKILSGAYTADPGGSVS
ncbi:substrate-binding domain-containing protein [Thauera sp. SDU_THAU2]|uniref:substrate-binding domain-containing protein n=1 Tax=Thauera sp. SDU_THAU2 TaxID=3136633 RepID=UPI00311F6EC7